MFVFQLAFISMKEICKLIGFFFYLPAGKRILLQCCLATVLILLEFIVKQILLFENATNSEGLFPRQTTVTA